MQPISALHSDLNALHEASLPEYVLGLAIILDGSNWWGRGWVCVHTVLTRATKCATVEHALE
jgi:hypothetical protein